jgi:hypothetical protein
MTERVKGVVSLSPWATGAGVSFRCEAGRCPVHECGAWESLNIAMFEGRVLTLSSIINGRSHLWGTAALIAPGIAITAKHTLQAFEDDGHLSEDAGSIILVGLRSSGAEIWSVQQFITNDDNDVAILTLSRIVDMIEPYVCNVCELSTVLPNIGERVMQVGFVAGRESYDQCGGTTKMDVTHVITAGKVSDICLDGRDRFSLPGPCIEIRGPTFGGMSGGPAFNERGQMIGIVSRSLDAGSDGSPAVSWVSLLWPMLFSPFQPAWPPGLSRATILDHPMVFIHDRWRLSLNTDRTTWTYSDGPPPTPDIGSSLLALQALPARASLGKVGTDFPQSRRENNYLGQIVRFLHRAICAR